MAAESDSQFAAEVPAFVAEIQRIFTAPEIRDYLANLERTKYLAPPYPDLENDDLDDEIEQEPWPENPIMGAEELLRFSRGGNFSRRSSHQVQTRHSYASLAERTQCNGNGTLNCCNAGGVPAPCCTGGSGSPIVIDTKGQGFHLTGTGNMVLFRLHAADSSKVMIDWTDSHYANAWLVLPVNGAVHGLDEMFGNLTPQPPSATPNGYLALAQYDLKENGGNGDGRIGPEDRIWKDLRLWKGRPNAAGASNPEDLYRPELVGVYGFALAYDEIPKADTHGNEFRYRSYVFLDPGRQPKANRSYNVFLLSAIPR